MCRPRCTGLTAAEVRAMTQKNSLPRSRTAMTRAVFEVLGQTNDRGLTGRERDLPAAELHEFEIRLYAYCDLDHYVVRVHLHGRAPKKD